MGNIVGKGWRIVTVKEYMKATAPGGIRSENPFPRKSIDGNEVLISGSEEESELTLEQVREHILLVWGEDDSLEIS